MAVRGWLPATAMGLSPQPCALNAGSAPSATVLSNHPEAQTKLCRAQER